MTVNFWSTRDKHLCHKMPPFELEQFCVQYNVHTRFVQCNKHGRLLSTEDIGT